jgi:hypothetical protein
VAGVFEPGAYTVFADARERESTGSYALSLETAPPTGGGATGDGCGDAIALVGPGATVAGDTFAARDDVAGSCGGSGAADVVYRLDVPRRSRFRATLEGEEAAHLLVVWRRCGDRASEIACGRSVEEVLTPGTYFVAVDGPTRDALGRYGLAWALEDLAPQAMACASAPLLVEGRAIAATTAGAGDRFATACGGAAVASGSADRVFHFSLAAPAKVRIEMTDSALGFDAFLALRKSCVDASGSAGGVQLACTGAEDGAKRRVIEAALEKGTYWVVVDGQSPNDQGKFTLKYAVIGAK